MGQVHSGKNGPFLERTRPPLLSLPLSVPGCIQGKAQLEQASKPRPQPSPARGQRASAGRQGGSLRAASGARV